MIEHFLYSKDSAYMILISLFDSNVEIIHIEGYATVHFVPLNLHRTQILFD